MKLSAMLLTVICMAAMANKLHAQAPEGFVKGSVTLGNGSIVSGYVKESIKKNAAISFADEKGTKLQYDGSQINAATVDTVNYLCIKGDFFKTICTGKICFLQKASDASNKASFNGTEAVFTSGTAGKIGDYFAYSNNQLTLLTKKTVNKFISEQLVSCNAAAEKAKAVNGDIPALADAVAIYNNSSK
ncbi:MAG: hypothetical protein U0V75_17705 [Ferruginibacter sp.]